MKNSNILLIAIGGVVILGSLYFLNKSKSEKRTETASNENTGGGRCDNLSGGFICIEPPMA